nr:hypothetical protein [Candidatus Freyarchaeota archaeon]
MFTRFILEDGTKVATPWLDGVFERALELGSKWLKKNPKLETIPSDALFLQALESADTLRSVEAFKAAGFDTDTALHYAHSHLPERFMMMGLLGYLTFYTWYFKFESPDPADPPTDFGLTEDAAKEEDSIKTRVSEEELRKIMYSEQQLPEAIGSEATEHLLKACLAYDRWVRSHLKSPKKRKKK